MKRNTYKVQSMTYIYIYTYTYTCIHAYMHIYIYATPLLYLPLAFIPPDECIVLV